MAFHSRSNSLPSRPHPLVSVVDEKLTGLRASQSTPTSSCLHRNLNGLQDLYDSVEKLLQLQSSQQTLDKEQANELLEGSLRLLDLCNTAKDALLHTKECLQEIQSVLRRRRGSEMELVKEASNYLSSKKTMRKEILKALKNLNHKENKQSSPSSELISILREVEAASSTVLQALLSFIAGPEKKRQWSSVAKIFGNKRVECEKEEEMNEITNAESAMQSLTRGGLIPIENLQSELQKSESCIEDIQEGINCLFRRLIRSRVTLLNILS